jgi:hypothetical protein
MHVSKQGLLVKCHKHIDPIDVRLNLFVGGSYAVIAVFAFDV